MVRTLPGLFALLASLSAQNRERPTIAVSPNNPLYLYAHFRDTDVVHLRLSYSSDRAISWQDVNPEGSFRAQALRDPSIIYVPNANPLLTGTFYFIVTPAVGSNVQFFSSDDLMNFSPITTIDIAALVPGATVAWAPEWWHDPRDGQYYFFIAVSSDPEGASSSTAVMLPYLVPFNPASASPSGFPVAIPLSGTTQKRTFDFFPYSDGSRYYLLYVDQQPAGSGGNVTQPIAFATSRGWRVRIGNKPWTEPITSVWGHSRPRRQPSSRWEKPDSSAWYSIPGL